MLAAFLTYVEPYAVQVIFKSVGVKQDKKELGKYIIMALSSLNLQEISRVQFYLWERIQKNCLRMIKIEFYTNRQLLLV